MHMRVNDYLLRRPEPVDAESLYLQKNDAEITSLLGGFHTGYSMADVKEWIENLRHAKDKIIWAVVEEKTNKCVGQVGLYQIDYRVRSAEFGIMLGDKSVWGKGLGRACTKRVIDYGFLELNLNRVFLYVLDSNLRAVKLYHSMGFQDEGLLRMAQFREGRYVNRLLMSLLRDEYCASEKG